MLQATIFTFKKCSGLRWVRKMSMRSKRLQGKCGLTLRIQSESKERVTVRLKLNLFTYLHCTYTSVPTSLQSKAALPLHLDQGLSPKKSVEGNRPAPKCQRERWEQGVRERKTTIELGLSSMPHTVWPGYLSSHGTAQNTPHPDTDGWARQAAAERAALVLISAFSLVESPALIKATEQECGICSSLPITIIGNPQGGWVWGTTWAFRAVERNELGCMEGWRRPAEETGCSSLAHLEDGWAREVPKWQTELSRAWWAFQERI